MIELGLKLISLTPLPTGVKGTDFTLSDFKTYYTSIVIKTSLIIRIGINIDK